VVSGARRELNGESLGPTGRLRLKSTLHRAPELRVRRIQSYHGDKITFKIA
jgi:hypothetical protein